MSLNINSVFFTIQGEGKHAGRRALFVRMPYCNLKCSWCDTEFDSFVKWEEEDFLAFAQKERCRFAVITGGEPMMNKHTERVIALLKSLNYEIACESNGTFPIFPGIDFVTVSPKREQKIPYSIHPQAHAEADEFKYVVDEGFDFGILKKNHPMLNPSKRYSLSPEYNNMGASLVHMFEFIKENPEWKISLQTHKWMKIP